MKIQKKDIEAIYPASPVQHALMLLNLDDDSPDPGFIHVQCDLEGSLDLETFRAAWNHVMTRHESLRMSVRITNQSKPMLIVCRSATCVISSTDLSEKTVEQQEQWIGDLCRKDQDAGIDLTMVATVRLQLVRLRPDAHRLIWACHHALLDGWSASIILNEVLHTYAQRLAKRQVELPPPIPLKRYLEWLSSQDTAAARTYWRSMLDGCIQPTSIADLRGHDAINSQSGDFRHLETTVSTEVVADVTATARQHQVTNNVVAMTAWSLLLASTAQSDDVIFGTVLAGRPGNLDNSLTMTGMFANAVPVRTKIDQNQSVKSHLSSIKNTLDESQEHQHLSVSEIQRECSDIPGRLRLFECLYVFENFSITDVADAESALRMRNNRSGLTSSYPLALSIIPGATWTVTCHYDTGRFSAANVENLLYNFIAVLQQITASTSVRVATLISDSHRPLLNAVSRIEAQTMCRCRSGNTEELRTPLERQLAGIWSDVLGIDRFSRDDNFFEIGGASMTMVELVARCQDAGLTVTPASIYEHPTIASLATVIQDQSAVAEASTDSAVETDSGAATTKEKDVSDDFHRLVNGEKIQGPIRLSIYQNKPNLFLIPPKGNKINQFWSLAKEISDYTCFSPFSMEEDIEEELTVQDLVPDFLGQIQSVQPVGPYRIVGYCDGAFVAWEIAQLLTEQGEEVHFLGNIDTPNPDSVKPIFRETIGQRIARRIRQIKTKSPLTLAWKSVRIGYDWMSRRVRKSISGERHLVHGGSRIAWLYRPEPYEGHATLLRLPNPANPEVTTDATYGWGDLALAGLNVVTVQGNRYEEADYFLAGKNAESFAMKLQLAIRTQEIDAKSENPAQEQLNLQTAESASSPRCTS